MLDSPWLPDPTTADPATDTLWSASATFSFSVRTVTYRLAKIADLTIYDARIPAQRRTLQASVVAARWLPWTGEAATSTR
jgi:hypothetical protein